MNPLEFVDVSSHNPDLDFPTLVAHGVHGVVIKVTEGVGYFNPLAHQQAVNARGTTIQVKDDSGNIVYEGPMLIGFYGWGHPDEADSPEAQADYCIQYARPLWHPGDGLFLDFEQPGVTGDLVPWALRWLGRAEADLVKPSIYSYPDYIRLHLQDPAITKYALWYASYDSVRPPAPAPWTDYTFWQYSGASRLPGDGGHPIDRSKFYGTPDDWKAMGGIVVDAPKPFGPFGVTLTGGFLKTWQDAGADALARYGYPVTPELSETIDGAPLTVQYFERARFEYDHATGAITFGRIGIELARARGYTRAQ